MINSFNRENAIFIGGYSSLTNGEAFPILSAAENSLIGCVGDIVINGHLCDPRQGSYVGDAVSGYGISKLLLNLHISSIDYLICPFSAQLTAREMFAKSTSAKMTGSAKRHLQRIIHASVRSEHVHHGVNKVN